MSKVIVFYTKKFSLLIEENCRFPKVNLAAEIPVATIMLYSKHYSPFLGGNFEPSFLLESWYQGSVVLVK